ncbi:MAG: indole-3-glycerol phosphate synthase TrpC [Phycisphaerae bacterium]|nr:indole-3-glycerol phosphate synthase TrpC [Phycisphaerae bacterium]NIP54313.1 indole-3-glycerol phosphate synthase TrpC [Phycisphaerae bacterium]NIS53182.1 indole-3-glycerol phosphate synthase TrpC [Phycisphaerae bacterium]NIU10667.1 indole-3-glycerol phosphate synthase TrpC [Phycisphaerae bacterium]NIU58428.1 indole-3-glycerol phosphate synthase TrpC [Phycisphaerae bacterium]
MANILDKIIADKKTEVELRKSQVSLDQLKEQVQPLPKCRNFYKAVTRANSRGINVIAEVKKASPSAGLIREDFDPVAIARTYKKCGADAISVLTDEKYFQGRLEYIKQISDAVDLPILRKDFIIDPWQVYESRAAGADAILLIADAIKPGELMDLMIIAAELTLTVLLEIHEADTLLKVRSLIGFPKKGYNVLGINNRNLTTMEVDLNTVSRLAELVDNKNELVAESGIKTHADVEKLKATGVSAVLIGQVLCENADIEEKFTELFG